MINNRRISMIVAMGLNREIGFKNTIPWRIRSDLQRFKKITKGNAVIMGRKTFESLPKSFKPLPKRQNIILTRNLDFQDFQAEGCEIAHSLEEAIGLADSDREVFIIGGQQIYEEALPYTNILHRSKVFHTCDADAYFPEIDPSNWKEVESEEVSASEKDEYPHLYQQLQRIER